MEVLKCKQDIRRVELCSILLEPSNLTQIEEKLTTRAILQAEVQLVLCLERVVHLHDKCVIHTFLYSQIYLSVTLLFCRIVLGANGNL